MLLYLFRQDVTKLALRLQYKSRRYALLHALLHSEFNPEEIMEGYDIYPRPGDLEPDVAAFVYRSRKDRFYIIVNSSLSYEERQKVFFHEVYHILEHMPRQAYILGMDMQRCEIEEEAEMFVKEVAAKYMVDRANL